MRLGLRQYVGHMVHDHMVGAETAQQSLPEMARQAATVILLPGDISAQFERELHRPGRCQSKVCPFSRKSYVPPPAPLSAVVIHYYARQIA